MRLLVDRGSMGLGVHRVSDRGIYAIAPSARPALSQHDCICFSLRDVRGTVGCRVQTDRWSTGRGLEARGQSPVARGKGRLHLCRGGSVVPIDAMPKSVAEAIPAAAPRVPALGEPLEVKNVRWTSLNE